MDTEGLKNMKSGIQLPGRFFLIREHFSACARSVQLVVTVVHVSYQAYLCPMARLAWPK